MHPPRALFVPFDFGRPLGAPNAPDFQRRVVVAALELLNAPSGPVIADFPDDAPALPENADAEDENPWVCPVDLSRPEVADDPDSVLAAVLAEISSLAPWYEAGKAKNNRTTVGVSEMKIEDAARYAASFLDGSPDHNPRDDMPAHDTLKLATEDLRAYTFESAVAQPGNATADDIFKWFWDETAMGRLFLELDEALQKTDDEGLKFLAVRMLIPRAQRDRMGEQADFEGAAGGGGSGPR